MEIKGFKNLQTILRLLTFQYVKPTDACITEWNHCKHFYWINTLGYYLNEADSVAFV